MSQLPPEKDPYASPSMPGKPEPYLEPTKTSGKAIASLLLSLISVFTCGITGIIALILGFMGLSDINNSQGRITGSAFAMSGIVLTFIGFAAMILVVPVLLLLPAVGSAREAARRNGCLSNTRQLTLAAFNHESAMKRFPLGTDATGPYVGEGAALPGSAEGDTAAGYSWTVKLLPYYEEVMLYDAIRESSGKMETPAFDSSVTDYSGQHPSQVQIPSLRCPSYSGDTIATAPEYMASPGLVAVGNYVGIPGTHIKADGTLEENGVLVSKWSRQAQGGKGVNIADIRDGTANTVLVAESREEAYGSWYDGQATWVTALRTDVDENNLTNGPVGLPQAPFDAAALDYGGDSDDTYFPAGRFPGQQGRAWGPSSEHRGLVHHGFADGHAQSFNSDVDPTIYMRCITRNGGEPMGLLE